MFFQEELQNLKLLNIYRWVFGAATDMKLTFES